MKRFLYFLILTALSISCRTNEPEKVGMLEDVQTDAFEIIPGEKVGLITALSTESSLKEDYGHDNLAMRSLSVGEGVREEGIVLFPGTRNEVEIFWDIEAANGHPAFVRITQDSTQWHTVAGVTVGTPIWELERRNGRPFTLNGFEWELAGLVTDWNGGKLSQHLIVVLIPNNYEAITPELTGDDVKLFSNDVRLQQLKLKVGALAVTFEK